MSLRASSSLRRLDCLLTLREPLRRRRVSARPARSRLLRRSSCARRHRHSRGAGRARARDRGRAGGRGHAARRRDARDRGRLGPRDRHSADFLRRQGAGRARPRDRGAHRRRAGNGPPAPNPLPERRRRRPARHAVPRRPRGPLRPSWRATCRSAGSLESEALAAAARLRELAGGDAAPARRRRAGAAASAKSVAALAALVLVVWLLERRLRPFVLAPLARRGEQAARERAAAGRGGRRLDATFLKAAAVRTSLRSTLLLAVELFVAFLCAQFVLRQFPYTEPLGNQLGRPPPRFGAGVGKQHRRRAARPLRRRRHRARGARRLAACEAVDDARSSCGLIDSAWLDAETARPTRILLGIGIVAMAMVIAYPFIPGSRSEAFKGVSVLIGVMVSLGGSSVIGQMIAGLVVLYSRAVRRGDFVTRRRARGRRRRGRTAGDAPDDRLRRADQHPQLGHGDRRFAQLDALRGPRRHRPAHRGHHRLRHALAAGARPAARRGQAHARRPAVAAAARLPALALELLRRVRALPAVRPQPQPHRRGRPRCTPRSSTPSTPTACRSWPRTSRRSRISRIVVPREQWAPDGAVADVPPPAKAAAPAVGAQRKA